MKEFFRRLVFSLWLYFGLSSFDEAVVNAPNGKVLSVLFHFKNEEEQIYSMGELISTTADMKTYYASNSLEFKSRGVTAQL